MTIKKHTLEKRLAIMLLVLKAQLISILVIVEQVLPLVNLPYTFINFAMKDKYLKGPYFQLNIMIKLKDSQQLVFYENHFHKRGY